MVDTEFEFSGSARLEEELLEMAFLADDLIPTSASVTISTSTPDACVEDAFESYHPFGDPILIGYDDIAMCLSRSDAADGDVDFDV